MKHPILSGMILMLFIGLAFNFEAAAQTTVNITGPAGSGTFGIGVFALSNGNIVVADPGYDIANGAQNVGAVYLYNGANRNLISRITGSSTNDFISNAGIKILPNGNFVINSPNWDNGAVPDAGASTFVNGTNGLSGVISATNSLVGSTANNQVGFAITVLTDGDYVVRSSGWDNGTVQNVGAATFASGTTGITGVVSATNSLVGSSAGSFVGFAVIALSDGDYVVRSPNWNNGSAQNVGAATFGSGTTGITGVVSATNSLVGSSVDDFIGFNIVALTNGNYVVGSPDWRNGGVDNVGAATFGNGTSGISGVVSTANSLYGSTLNDSIGRGITALTNGNYVTFSQFWANPRQTIGITNSGAATFGNGTTGITGAVSEANSLAGGQLRDNVSSGGVTALSNGNYVVSSPIWTVGGQNVGAATFGSGTSGITGIVSEANSLVGSGGDDNVSSSGITALSNGNYVVASPNWEDASTPLNVGAVTFGNGTSGITGTVTAANSLTGSTERDFVGSAGVTALTNGNYVVKSPNWINGTAQNAGAATFGNGVSGTTGVVSAANSLVSSTAQSFSGFFVTPLTNGNYVVQSSNWVNGTAANTGAATFGSGTSGISGTISAANSLIGSRADDFVGSGGIVALSNNDYVVVSPGFDNGAVVDAGAVTYGNGNGGTVGQINNSNSVIGTANNGSNIRFAFDAVNNQLVVGRPADNIVTLFRPGATPTTPTKTRFDFDGDGRADISVFRPSNSVWYVNRSTNGFSATQFGLNTDLLTPADYDGDGKTDIAVRRDDSTIAGKTIFIILRSSDNTFRFELFGRTEDIPYVVGDWDGDGIDDMAVYRDGSFMGGQSFFFYFPSSNTTGNPRTDFISIPWGAPGDLPMRGDFDGDGKQDAAVFRPSNNVWYIRQSSNGQLKVGYWGLSTDKFVPADYDGDGKTDLAVVRNGIWYILQSSNNQPRYEQFGFSSDKPVPADYDGDGRTDIAVFRDGVWYLQQSTSGFAGFTFGTATDRPVPERF